MAETKFHGFEHHVLPQSDWDGGVMDGIRDNGHLANQSRPRRSGRVVFRGAGLVAGPESKNSVPFCLLDEGGGLASRLTI